ncbi:hypothetical protein [Sphingomonas sp. S-NIH.Pt3_0716]|uniref:hypothetical protein n=1 Tax=Rhizobium sp. TaxID=391 RepID=UPI000F7EDBA7|nr:hypothetical protein BRX37_24760 [Sphingomonas sp. S-NIH.Pt3_0716]
MSQGTAIEPNWYEGSDTSEEGFGYHIRHFSYMTDAGPVVGLTASLMFTLDVPSAIAWEFVSDFNSFEGPFGFRFSGAWGRLYDSEEHDLGQQTLRYQTSTGEWSEPARVIRVIPQHLLTLFEPVPEDGRNGGISPGFQTVVLNDHDSRTTVTAVFEHAERLPPGTTEEEALARSIWGPGGFDSTEPTRLWKDEFVPLLRKMVAGRAAELDAGTVKSDA